MRNIGVQSFLLPAAFLIAVLSTGGFSAADEIIAGSSGYSCVSRPAMARPPTRPAPLEQQASASGQPSEGRSGEVHLNPICLEGMIPVPVPTPTLKSSVPEVRKGNPLIGTIPSEGLLENKNVGDIVRQNLRPFDEVYWKDRTTLAPLVSSSPLCDGISNFGSCYYYASASSRPASTANDGAGMTQTIARPAYVNTGGPGHTLDEIAVQGGSGDGNIVELGWNVSTDQYGNAHPHLFVFHWKNWQPTCYDACGWKQWSSTYYPGMDINALVGRQVRVYYLFWKGNWWAWFDNQWIGYFPGTEWGGQFSTATLVQWFGEVASQNGMPPKTQMGRGLLPTNANAARMTNLCLVNATATTWDCRSGDPRALGATVPKYYDIKRTALAATRYGGPGR